MENRIQDLEARLQSLTTALENETARRRAAEEALRLSQQKLDKLFVASPVWMLVATVDEGRYLEVNDAVVHTSGYTREEMIGRTAIELGLWPDPAQRAAAREIMARDGRLERHPCRLRMQDGRLRDFLWSAEVIELQGQRCHLSVLTDVTEARRAEDAQAESEARYRSLFEQASDALIVADETDAILEVNRKACELLGYTREELQRMKIPDVQAPECRGTPGQVIRHELAHYRGRPFETLDRRKDGAIIPVEVTSTRLGAAGPALSIVRDIQERKRMTQALTEAHEILERSPVVAFLWENRPGWPVAFVTRNVQTLFGYTAEDFTAGQAAYADVLHPDDRERVAAEVAACSGDAACREFVHRPYRIVTRDAQIRWVEDKTFIRRSPQGAVTHYQGLVEDISARIQAEEALRRSEERYRQFIELSLEGIWRLAFDAPIPIDLPPEAQVRRIQQQAFVAECNDTFARYYGYADAEAVKGMRLMDFYGTSPSPQNFQATLALVKSGYRAGDRETVEVASDGQRLYFVNNAVGMIANGQLVGLWGTQRDITEKRLAEQALVAEKERLAVTLRSIGDAVICTDRAGIVTLLNPVAETLTGWPEAEAVGQPLNAVFRIVNENTRQPCPNPIEAVLASGQVVGLANHTLLLSRGGGNT